VTNDSGDASLTRRQLTGLVVALACAGSIRRPTAGYYLYGYLGYGDAAFGGYGE
jgi:hypothetical protein